MQLLFLQADPPGSERRSQQLTGHDVHIYTPGMVSALFLSLSLAALLYLLDWNPSAPSLDPHTRNLWFIAIQTILIFLICWLCTLVGSLFQRRQNTPLTASQQATGKAIQGLLRWSGALFLVLTVVVLVSKIERGHALPALLFASLFLLLILLFRPNFFTISWVAAHMRGNRDLIGTTLVDFSTMRADQATPGAGVAPPDPNR